MSAPSLTALDTSPKLCIAPVRSAEVRNPAGPVRIDVIHLEGGPFMHTTASVLRSSAAMSAVRMAR
jgi:hypothetical protein